MCIRDRFSAFRLAAHREQTEILKYLWSICPDDLKPKMLKVNDFGAFTGSASHKCLNALEYLFSHVSYTHLDVYKRQANNYEAFWSTARNGDTKTLEYLWSICPDQQKHEMVEADNFLAFRLAAGNGHIKTLEYLKLIYTCLLYTSRCV